jgi:hypothetical protein
MFPMEDRNTPRSCQEKNRSKIFSAFVPMLMNQYSINVIKREVLHSSSIVQCKQECCGQQSKNTRSVTCAELVEKTALSYFQTVEAIILYNWFHYPLQIDQKP